MQRWAELTSFLTTDEQVIYDPLRKEHYMFGGNPSRLGEMSRLDDFWRLSIVRCVAPPLSFAQ